MMLFSIKKFQRHVFSTAILFSALLLPVAGLSEPISVITPRGATLEMIADFPAGNGPFAAVVLAPGQGYHMRLPAIEQTAKAMIAQQIAVFRFNWAYFSKDQKTGKPSDDLVAEIEDMTTVLAKARNDPRVSKDRFAVAGKSLGSIVAWHVLAKDQAIKGGLFLTPVCSRTWSGVSTNISPADENYPGVDMEKRALAFITGELDPLCSAPALYRFAAAAGGKVRVAIVGGDHSFSDPTIIGPAGDEVTMKNLQLVARLSADFVRTMMRRTNSNNQK